MSHIKKVPFLSYAAAPFMIIIVYIISSLVTTYVLHLRGDNSPVPFFIFFALINLVFMTLYALLPAKRKNTARYFALIIIGSILLIPVGILGMQNLQLEGLFFFALGGVFGGVMIHFFIAKIAGPVIMGRTWCGWGCWTVMVLDLFPYKKSKGWAGGLSKFKYIYFFLALTVIFLLVFGFDYTIHSVTAPGSLKALYWFIAGNALYYIAGIALAFLMKDNRAFCKYLCPVSIFLKLGSLFSILRIKGESEKCTDCGTCTTHCVMNIKIPEYLKAGERVTSTECIMCMKCVASCPEAVLKSSVGFDFVREERVVKY